MKKNQLGFSVIEILIILAIAGLIGLAGWLVYSRPKNTKTTGITQQTSETEQDTTADKTNTPVAIENKSATKVIYIPENAFSVDEKVSLDQKLVQPNIDYAEQFKEKESYNPISSISITKKTDAEYASMPAYAKYRYSVSIINKFGNTDFLFAQNDTTDWWLPECSDGKCAVSDSFKAMYPEIIAKLVANGETILKI